MDLISSEIITVFKYLLPGFVSAWVFYGLTAYPKPSQFERVIQALIFNLFVQVLIIYIHWIFTLWGLHIFSFGYWTENIALSWSLIIAILIGLGVSYCANSDKIHAILRKGGLTKETSYPSEWFGVFHQNKTYVVLHLKGERRLYGWPNEWPSQPNSGHFSIAEAEWLDDKKRIPLENVTNILIPADEVVFVEFMTIIEDTHLSPKKED
jgi:hypothetical protein